MVSLPVRYPPTIACVSTYLGGWPMFLNNWKRVEDPGMEPTPNDAAVFPAPAPQERL